jgi:hypothetical protein
MRKTAALRACGFVVSSTRIARNASLKSSSCRRRIHIRRVHQPLALLGLAGSGVRAMAAMQQAWIHTCAPMRSDEFQLSGNLALGPVRPGKCNTKPGALVHMPSRNKCDLFQASSVVNLRVIENPQGVLQQLGQALAGKRFLFVYSAPDQ